MSAEVLENFKFLDIQICARLAPSLAGTRHYLLRSVNFKMSFWCRRFDQKINEFFLIISALASKKMSNQKNKCTLLYQLRGIYYNRGINFFI